MKARELKKKGWNKKEIDETLKLVEKAKRNKDHTIKLLDKAVFWIALMAAIVGNFVVAVALMPFLLAFEGLKLYFFVVVLGLVIGLSFELFIRSMAHLKKGHHLFFGFFIPLLALANGYLITFIANVAMPQNINDPIIVGIVYAIAFIIPYISYHLVLKE